MPAAASPSSSSRSPAPASPLESTVSSSKRTTIPPPPSPTAPMPFPFHNSPPFSPASKSFPPSSASGAHNERSPRANLLSQTLFLTDRWSLVAAMSLETARRVLKIESQAINEVLSRLDASFERAVDLLFACQGRVAVTGMGKSGIVGRKISATLSSTGTPSFFLHPAEALHGDLGMIARGDVMLAVSYAGETREIIALLDALKRLEIPLVALTGNPKSTIAQAGEIVLDVSVSEEACSLN